MVEMHTYPLREVAAHDFDGVCSCAFTVQEVVWDDEPDTTYLLVTHYPMREGRDA